MYIYICIWMWHAMACHVMLCPSTLRSAPPCHATFMEYTCYTRCARMKDALGVCYTLYDELQSGTRASGETYQLANGSAF